MPPVVHIAHAFRVNRGRELPVLVDSDQVIAGSQAIAEHVDSRHPEPRLLPTERKLAAETRAWSAWADGVLAPDTRRVMTLHWWREPADSERYFFSEAPRGERAAFRVLRRPFALLAIAMRGSFPAAVRSAQERVDGALEDLDAVFSEREHLVGDALTLADLSLAVAVNMAFVPAEGRDRHAGTPTLALVERTLPDRYKRWLLGPIAGADRSWGGSRPRLSTTTICQRRTLIPEPPVAVPTSAQ